MVVGELDRLEGRRHLGGEPQEADDAAAPARIDWEADRRRHGVEIGLPVHPPHSAGVAAGAASGAAAGASIRAQA